MAISAFFLLTLSPSVSSLARADEAADLSAKGITDPSIATSLPDDGDPLGARKALAERGISIRLNYTNDVLANVDGGKRRGVIDQGLLEAALTIDLDKMVGWKGMTIFSNAFQIHDTGRMLRDYVGGINTIAAIEAQPTTRLSELWAEQAFWGGKASFRIGQLASDTEFFFSDTSTIFLQSDWATIVAEDVPSGGAAYPLATPGIRLKVAPNDKTAFLIELLNGDPAGPGSGDPQLRDRYGVNFRVSDPPFLIGEAQFKNDPGKTGLAQTLKFGAWNHFGNFADQRLASDGLLLADPASSGSPEIHRGDWGIYGIIDQQIYRPAGKGADDGITIYSRISGSPSDRNLIDFYLDGGIVFSGMVPNRPDDKFGLGFIYSKYSNSVSDFDRESNSFSGLNVPVQDFEANVELSYAYQVIPGWIIQPDLQFIWHPSGDASRDATVVGVRTALHY